MILYMVSWVGYHYKIKSFFSIMNYWFKILESEETRFIKHAYQLLLNDIANNPNCVNCVSKVNFCCRH